jgi:hypothetical protein
MLVCLETNSLLTRGIAVVRLKAILVHCRDGDEFEYDMVDKDAIVSKGLSTEARDKLSDPTNTLLSHLLYTYQLLGMQELLLKLE